MNMQVIIAEIKQQMGWLEPERRLGQVKKWRCSTEVSKFILEGILLRIQQNQSLAEFQLTSAEISTLVDMAIEKKIKINFQYRQINLLTLLLSTGTVVTTPDVFSILEQKDASIEQHIIHKAIIKNQQTSHHPLEKKSVVFGLSGNPPTHNHALFIEHLADTYDNSVHVVLNALNPLKKGAVDPEIRYEMLTTLLVERGLSKRCQVERLEIDRCAPSRMVATMSALVLMSEPHTHFTLALGWDGLKTFTKWYNWVKLSRLCEIAFYSRPGEFMDRDAMKNWLKPLKNAAARIKIIFATEAQHAHFHSACEGICTRIEPIKTEKGSSTEARLAYADGALLAPPGISPGVDAIVRAHGLYLPEPVIKLEKE